MKNPAMSNLLKQLHAALNGATSTTDKDRELLEQISADIRGLLAQPGPGARAAREPIIEQLRTAVTRFEVSHPDLTATMSQVSQTLADMGI